MRRWLALGVLLGGLGAVAAPAAGAQDQGPLVRLKDVARVVGVRDNALWGYGLVVGLDGTGDRATSSFFTVQALQNALIRQGLVLPPDVREQLTTKLAVKNTAAVMVTAKLPAFARAGSRLDVTVSSIGDATSLLGGTLLPTPLGAGDSQAYALAAGPVSIGGAFAVRAGGQTAQKNHPTAGRVPGGATVEREVDIPLDAQGLRVALLAPDFLTAARVEAAINQAFAAPLAHALDAATVAIAVPTADTGHLVDFLARLEEVPVRPDTAAKVVINERTGTVILGGHVRVSTVAVAHGNLAVQIRTETQVSQPPPLAPRGSATVVVPQTDLAVGEDKQRLMVFAPGASIGEVVAALNAIGATPRDLIAILQAMREAGALNADLEMF